MSTVKILGDLMPIVDEEVARSIENYGNLKSEHEAYAVMLEEFEEADCEFNCLEQALNNFWISVKTDTNFFEELPTITEKSLKAAAELIQVAAMAEKFMRQGGRASATSGV